MYKNKNAVWRIAHHPTQNKVHGHSSNVSGIHNRLRLETCSSLKARLETHELADIRGARRTFLLGVRRAR